MAATRRIGAGRALCSPPRSCHVLRRRRHQQQLKYACECLELRVLLAQFLVQGTNGNDTIVVDLIGGNMTATGAVNAPAPMSDATVDSIFIQTLNGIDSITINATGSGNPTTIQAGNGNDTIIIAASGNNLSTITSTILADGQGDTDTLDLRDSVNGSNSSYMFSEGLQTTFQRSGTGVITYAGIDTFMLKCGTGNNSVFADATDLDTNYTILAGAGDDTLTADMQHVDRITFNGEASTAGGGDSLTLDDSAGTSTDITYITDTSSSFPETGGRHHVNFPSGDVEHVLVSGGATGATYNVGSGDLAQGNMDNLPDTTVDGGGGGDRVIANDSTLPAADTYRIFNNRLTRPFMGGLSYTNATAFELRAQTQANQINVVNTTASIPMTLNGGGGNDTVTVGADTIPGAGDLDNLGGAINYVGGGGGDTAIVNDLNNSLSDTYTITGSSVTRPRFGGFTFDSGVGSLTLNCESGSNTINMNNLANAPFTTVNGGNGDDTVNVGSGDLMDAIFLGFTLNGQGGSDSLNVDDHVRTDNNVNYAVLSNAVQITNQLFAVNYATIEAVSLKTTQGINHIDVTSIAAATPVNVESGNGNDTVDIGPDLSLIAGTLTLDGGAGTSDLLSFGDSSRGSTVVTYTFNFISALFSGATGSVVYFNFESVIIDGTNGADTYNVGTSDGIFSVSTRIDINAGTGLDTVNVNTDNSGTASARVHKFNSLANAFNIGSGGTMSVLQTLRTKALTMSATGAALDLAGYGMIIDYTGIANTPLNTIKSLITSGYANGAWTGNGIRSSTAAAHTTSVHPEAVGYAEASTLGLTSFLGVTVDSTSVLMRWTYAGDANLDETVNGLDFNRLAASFNQQTGRLWTDADFNFDGRTNLPDFNILARGYGAAPI